MRLVAQLQAFDGALLAWARYRDIPFEQYVQEQDTQYMVEHAMLLAIQAAIDIATGIAVMMTPKRPDTYRETFLLLGNCAVIPKDLSRQLSHLAGFRNLLVHEYASLDRERSYRVLQDDYRTLAEFRDIVLNLIRGPDFPSG